MRSACLSLSGLRPCVLRFTLIFRGKRLCSGGGKDTEPGEIKVWDLETGKVTHTLRGHTFGVISLALSGDGKWLVSGSAVLEKTGQAQDQIKVWDLHTRKETLTMRGH